MERLYFGARRRRIQRRRRIARTIALVGTLAALLFGIPGPGIGIELAANTLERTLVATDDHVQTTESAASAMRFRAGVFESRPAPSLSPTPTIDLVTATIYDAAEEFGLEGDYLLSVAECESGLNPTAYNSAGYHGLFQFDQTTWAAYGYGSIYDPVAQARSAARLLADGQSSRWPNCA